jgi:hypothetical protein
VPPPPPAEDSAESKASDPAAASAAAAAAATAAAAAVVPTVADVIMEPRSEVPCPAAYLAEDDASFRCLSQLLDPSLRTVLSEAVVMRAWNLLCRLPSHKKTKESITSLSGVLAAASAAERQRAWDEVLSASSPQWMLYSLQIVNRLLSGAAEGSQNSAGVDGAAANGGSRVVWGTIEGKETPAADPAAGGAAGAGVATDAAAAAAVVEKDKSAVAPASPTPSASEHAIQWQLQFLEAGGLQHLFALVLARDGPLAVVTQGVSDDLVKEASASLLGVFNYFLLAAIESLRPELQLSQLRLEADKSVQSLVLSVDSAGLVAALGKQRVAALQSLLQEQTWTGYHSRLVATMTYILPTLGVPADRRAMLGTWDGERCLATVAVTAVTAVTASCSRFRFAVR